MPTSSYLPVDCAVYDDAGEASAMVGESAAMQRLRSQLRRIGPYFRTALIRGEAGTGKQLAARMLHGWSPAASAPFTLWDGTDARTLDAVPHRGSVFVDEVGELPMVAQGALLRLLQRLERARGQGEPTRVITSTRHDLRILATTGRFRQDLYYRIATIEVTVPPLRERLEDIPALVQHFATTFRRNGSDGLTRITDEAMEWLEGQLWPGNVRELESALRAAAVAASGDKVEARHIAGVVAGSPTPEHHGPKALIKLQDVVDQHVLRVLERCEGNKLRAAELLGISRSTLYRMLEAYTATQRAG